MSPSATTPLDRQLEAILSRLPALPDAAPPPAEPAPVVSPATNTTNIQQTSGLRPNPPPVFDGNRSKGRAFLQAVRAHADLVPTGFWTLLAPLTSSNWFALP